MVSGRSVTTKYSPLALGPSSRARTNPLKIPTAEVVTWVRKRITTLSENGWAPPVAAVIPYLPAISQAQDNQIPAVTRVDVLAKAMHNLAEPLYPGSAPGENGSNGHNGKSRLRIPHFRFT